MKVNQADWNKYVQKLSSISKEAGDQLQAWIDLHGMSDMVDLINYAYALSEKYGSAAAALAAEMYDAIARLSNVSVPAAEVANTATYGEVAKAMYGTVKQNKRLSDTIQRLVKQSSADTMRNNAIRDGAEWAWIPSGDTCAFCITLASRGWQKASKKVLKGDHCDHIHAHCDCQFMVRFDSNTEVAGYDPEEYKKMYDEAKGSNSKERINFIRRNIESNKRNTIKYPNGDIIKLTNEEHRAINKYISSSSYIINEKLRNGTKLNEYQELLIKNLDSALKKLPNYQGSTTRSLDIHPSNLNIFLEKFEINKKVKFKEYISTTCGDIYNPNGNVQIMIVNSKSGKDLTPINQAELEILFERDSEFNVVYKEVVGGKAYIVLEE